MKVKLLTSMAGDRLSHAAGDIVDTAHFATPGGISPKQIADGWIAAGIASLPVAQEIVEADVKRVAQERDDAKQEAEAARLEAEDATAEARELRARVKELSDDAKDNAVLRAADLAAELAVTRKTLQEREAQLSNARATITDEVRATLEQDFKPSDADKRDPAEDAALEELNVATKQLQSALVAAPEA